MVKSPSKVFLYVFCILTLPMVADQKVQIELSQKSQELIELLDEKGSEGAKELQQNPLFYLKKGNEYLLED